MTTEIYIGLISLSNGEAKHCLIKSMNMWHYSPRENDKEYYGHMYID